MEADRPRVGILAVGDPAEADPVLRAGRGEQLVPQDVAVRGERGADVALDDRPEPGRPAFGVRDRRRGREEQRILVDRLREPVVELGDRLLDR